MQSKNSATKKRCSWSRTERIEWLTMLEQSGQSLSEFCRANDLAVSSVLRWRKQLRAPETAQDAPGVLLEVPAATLAESLQPSETTPW